MRLTTKRNRWYFWRELFSYMIPMILIAWTIDVFYHFIQCPLHPEWSAPCNINWILAIIYGVFLLLTIIFEIIAAKSLKNVRKQIEESFLESINSNEINNKKKSDEDEWVIDLIEKSKHEEYSKFEEWIKTKQENPTKRKIFKRKTNK